MRDDGTDAADTKGPAPDMVALRISLESHHQFLLQHLHIAEQPFQNSIWLIVHALAGSAKLVGHLDPVILEGVVRIHQIPRLRVRKQLRRFTQLPVQFPDKSFDVVFTDALLIYIGPDKIRNVVEEMLRVARKGLLFTEWHFFEPENSDMDGLGIRHCGLWKRDYVALLKNYSSPENVLITKITSDVWPDANWQTVGAFVQVWQK